MNNYDIYDNYDYNLDSYSQIDLCQNLEPNLNNNNTLLQIIFPTLILLV